MQKRSRRSDFHVHSLLGEGELLPSEIARRCEEMGYKAVAITEHVDFSNLELIKGLRKACGEFSKSMDITVIAGAELTHIPPASIARVTKLSRKLGAEIVIVHGETTAEPVKKGTNRAALEADIDILAHPGLVSEEDAELAAERGIFLELSARRGHCLTNGHVASAAVKGGARLIVNSDAHAPEDFITQEKAFSIALGSGLSKSEAKKAVENNPAELLKRLGY